MNNQDFVLQMLIDNYGITFADVQEKALKERRPIASPHNIINALRKKGLNIKTQPRPNVHNNGTHGEWILIKEA